MIDRNTNRTVFLNRDFPLHYGMTRDTELKQETAVIEWALEINKLLIPDMEFPDYYLNPASRVTALTSYIEKGKQDEVLAKLPNFWNWLLSGAKTNPVILRYCLKEVKGKRLIQLLEETLLYSYKNRSQQNWDNLEYWDYVVDNEGFYTLNEFGFARTVYREVFGKKAHSRADALVLYEKKAYVADRLTTIGRMNEALAQPVLYAYFNKNMPYEPLAEWERELLEPSSKELEKEIVLPAFPPVFMEWFEKYYGLPADLPIDWYGEVLDVRLPKLIHFQSSST